MNQSPSVLVESLAYATASQADLESFKKLVLAGEEVSAETLPSLMQRSVSLVFARRDKELVGVGAIKQPNPSYHAKVFSKAKVPHEQARFGFELGWVVVQPSVRRQGVANLLVESLVASLKGSSAYATSRIDNEPMHGSLKNFGFAPVGTPYPSQQNQPNIQLFIRA